MESLEPFPSLGVALAAGLLIGMERQQSSTEGSSQGPGPAPAQSASTYPRVSPMTCACPSTSPGNGGKSLSLPSRCTYW